jgi:RsiW-degrading membrane proteinase PrsW (M82 family)
MNFETLFMYAYCIFQLAVFSFRRTLRASTLIFLFFVGALSCISATVVAQSLVLGFFGRSAWTTALLATIEELAKAAPIAYLLFRTRVGQMVGLVDGVLIGAAIGAGFGFAEDAIYTVENARLSSNVAAYGGFWNIVLSWLPGGWISNRVWFPGHLVLNALMGAGLIFVRRMMQNRSVHAQAGVAAAVFAFIAFLHVGFNVPDAVASGVGYLAFAVASGVGRFGAILLFVLLVVFHYLEDAMVRPATSAGDPAPSPPVTQSAPLLEELSSRLAAVDRGWAHVREVARIERHRRQLANIEWERRRAAKPAENLVAVADWLRNTIASELAELAGRPAERKPLSALSLANAIGPLRRALSAFSMLLAPSLTAASCDRAWRRLWTDRFFGGAVLFDAGVLVVTVYGFWLVFVSPFMAHSGAVAIANSGLPFAIGVFGQILVIWQSVSFLRRTRGSAEPVEAADAVAAHCQTILAWTGVLGCAVALKSLYDLKSFPYPFRPGEVYGNWSQYQSCYGPAGATSGVGPATSPIVPLTRHRASGVKPGAGL